MINIAHVFHVFHVFHAFHAFHIFTHNQASTLSTESSGPGYAIGCNINIYSCTNYVTIHVGTSRSRCNGSQRTKQLRKQQDGRNRVKNPDRAAAEPTVIGYHTSSLLPRLRRVLRYWGHNWENNGKYGRGTFKPTPESLAPRHWPTTKESKELAAQSSPKSGQKSLPGLLYALHK